MRTLVMAMLCAGLLSCGAETVVMLNLVGAARVPEDLDHVQVTIKKGTEVVFPRDSRDVNSFQLPGGKLVDTKPTIAIVAGEVVADGKITVLVSGTRTGAFQMSSERDTLLSAESTTTLEISLPP